LGRVIFAPAERFGNKEHDMNLTAKQVATLNDLLSDFDTRLRSYSGRGMYGKDCVGVDLENSAQIASVFFSLGERCQSSGDDRLASLGDGDEQIKTDSMGRGLIVYWPDVYVADAALLRDADEEDDDARG
jgi:hypothetical protein